MGQIVQQNSAIDAVDKLVRCADMFAKSDIIPVHYRGNQGNVFVAVQTAYRMNLDPMMVMQGTYVVKGKLGMTSSFAIALANTSGILKGGIRYRIEGEGNDLKVTAYSNLKENNEEISYTISMREAKAEGWTSNSKYQSLPELMLRYRSAILLIRTHIPEVINGLHTVEELREVEYAKVPIGVNPQKEIITPVSFLDKFVEREQQESEIVVSEVREFNDSCILELKGLVVEYNIPQELVSKWCNAGGVTTLEELDSDKVQSCIDYIIKRN